MELVLAALVTAFGSVIVALVSRGLRTAGQAESKALAAAELALASARDAAERLESIERQTATNGSRRTLGELTVLMYSDLQETKRDLAEHQRRVDAHGIQPWWERKS